MFSGLPNDLSFYEFFMLFTSKVINITFALMSKWNDLFVGIRRPFPFTQEGDEIIFICPNNCGRKYKHKCNLYKHLKYECGKVGQFECTICFKRYTQKASLKTHMGLIHKIIAPNMY